MLKPETAYSQCLSGTWNLRDKKEMESVDVLQHAQQYLREKWYIENF
jgi:hypothetical protein